MLSTKIIIIIFGSPTTTGNFVKKIFQTFNRQFAQVCREFDCLLLSEIKMPRKEGGWPFYMYVLYLITWFAQLVESQTAVQGDQGFKSQTNTQSLKITKENVLPLKWLDVQVFSDKDYKP